MSKSAPTRQDTPARDRLNTPFAAEAHRPPLAARRHPLVAEVRKRLIDRCGFTGGRLVVGVSGGADSLALLLAVCVIRSQSKDGLRIEPLVVHVHHHLRDSADADAAHVEAVCESLGVPCRVEDVHIAATANVAAEARRVRYDALLRIARESTAAAVATAHHAEDQLETMLMALARGAGPDGLSGMAWRRSLSENIALLRPLLASRKTDCESLCEAARITWREDPTNRDMTSPRARLRHDVLPVIESLWPDAAKRAAGTAEMLHLSAELLEERLEEVFGAASQCEWNRSELASQPVALIAAGLRRAALTAKNAASESLSKRHLFPAAEAIVHGDRSPKTFELTPGLTLTIRAESVYLTVET